MLANWEYKEKTFDYSKIYTVNGVVTKKWWSYDSGSRGFTGHSYTYIEISLDNGKKIKENITHHSSEYSEGDTVIIYTDGTHYSLYQRGVVGDATGTMWEYGLGIASLALMCAVWICFFGVKGFIIGVLIFIFTFIDEM